MSYRAELVDEALVQFHDLQRDHAASEALMNRIVRLVEEPWDAWLVESIGRRPIRETTFGDHHEGMISFYVDDDVETLSIFNLVWAG